MQTDRQICDVPGRSFHVRQLMVGTRYMQLPYMWRQLTFEMPQASQAEPPDIVELSAPRWLEDLGLPEELKARVTEAGLTQLVFKAPTRGLSLHLGFDYVGEHKMGPLSIAMSKVKEGEWTGAAAALSMARVRTLRGETQNTAIVTTGPSLHGKSTLTIMIELAEQRAGRAPGPEGGPRGRGLPDERRHCADPATAGALRDDARGAPAPHLPRHRRHGEQLLRGAGGADEGGGPDHVRRAAGDGGRRPTVARRWRTWWWTWRRASRTFCRTPHGTCG